MSASDAPGPAAARVAVVGFKAGHRFEDHTTGALPGRDPRGRLWTRCHSLGTDTAQILCFHRGMQGEAPPTVKQIYALAGVPCEKAGETFPKDRGAASALLDRLKGPLRPVGPGVPQAGAGA